MSARLRSFRMNPDRYPIAVPHLSSSRGVLYFGAKALRQASEREQSLLSQCDGSVRFCDLATTPEDARAIAALSPWLLWWDGPLPAPPAPSLAPSRLVLSTSPASPWLAMGGRLLMEASTCPTTVVTCFGHSAQTVDPYAFGSPDEVAVITRDELSLVGRLTGVPHELWEFPARELRSDFDPDQSTSPSDAWLKSMLREVIEETIARTNPVEIFVPASSEPDSDAGVVLDVVLAMFIDGLLGASKIHVFESSAVVSGARAVDEFLGRFENSYLKLPEYFVDMTPRIAHKASVLEVFRSRVDRKSREQWLESTSWNSSIGDLHCTCETTESRGGHAERFWAVSLA
jgi:hypothetical protein